MIYYTVLKGQIQVKAEQNMQMFCTVQQQELITLLKKRTLKI